MKNKINILHLEDSSYDSELVHSVIEKGGIRHGFFFVDNEKDFLHILKTENINLILSDYSMPGYNGHDALKVIREKYPLIPFIFVSGFMGDDAAINAMLNGATDYVLKNKLEKLVPAIKRAIHEHEIETKRKQAEEAMIVSELRYRCLFESAKDGILILDAETGMIVDVNPFLIDLLGYSKAQFIEKTIWEISFFKDIVANKDKFLELQQKEYVRYEDLPLKTADGKQINVEFVSNVYLVDHQKVIQCNIRDITERKRAEALVQINYSIQTTLNSILQLSIENIPLTELLRQTLVMILDIPNLNFESKGCIFLLNKDTKEFEMVVEKNLSESLKKACKSVLLGFCHCGRAASTQKLQFSKKLDKKHEVTYEGITDHGDYCMPIVYRDITLGVINVELNLSHLKNQIEINFLHAIANTLAGIIVRKNSEDELQKTLDNLELVVIQRTEELNTKNIELKEEIEERINIESELNKLAIAVDQNPVSIIITKPDATVEYVNNQFLTISGFTREELIGNKTTLLKSGIHDTAFYKELWDTILSGKTWKGIICNKNKSGELYWEQNTISPVFDDNGAISNFIGMKEDVSKLKRTEEELIKSKESAEDANRMKSEFLANMSHEIRTPLNAIVGFSSILKEKTSGQKIFTEYLDNIIQSSKVLLALINDILDLSKVESGRMVIEYQPVNLSSLIFELQSVFLMKAKEKGISINIQISKDIPGSLITDEKFLRQILFNLIGNAVKFTNKGSVDIFVNIIPKETEASKVDLIFIVKDSGIGIPDDQLTVIFDPFIQVAQKNRSKYGGTGLGLSITKRLVELMGGLIVVESEIGHGSTFSFSLFNVEISSLRHDENKNNNNHKILNIKFNNPVILMAEDILSNRQVIKGYLEPLNITIIETENGEDCISVARKSKPDLILMDMQMPVMDGFTAINILKSDNELKDIPVIALSASGMKQQRDQFKKVADDFLIKPIYKNDLLEKLIKYLPYEELPAIELHPEEILATPMYIDVENKLPDEIKKKIDQTFLKEIVELEEVLNIEELLTFIKQLEKINEEYQISKIKEYCDLLTQYVESFNIKQINTCLKELLKFINK